MSNPNPERDERVRQREEVAGQLIRTILSRQRQLNNLRELKDQFVRGEVSEQVVLSLIGTADNAAARMRDRCVEKVKSVRDSWNTAAINERRAASEIITALQSLEGEQEK